MFRNTPLYIPVTGSFFIVTCIIFYFGYHFHLETVNEITSSNLLSIFMYLVLGFVSAVLGYISGSGLIIYPDFFFNKTRSGLLLRKIITPTHINILFTFIGNVSPYFLGISIATDAVKGI